MLRHERSAPIWLFSFVDLAFLLLIAFTQIGPEMDATGPPIGQLEIPRLETDAAPLAGNAAAAAWQLRVHPTSISDAAEGAHVPFELIDPLRLARPAESPEANPSESTTRRIDARQLATRLERLRTIDAAKPILAPHRDARAEDLLVAVGLLEEAFRGNRSVAVLPAPAVSAGPLQAREELH